MPLSPGAKLGHYEIIELLGAGGMGEVYRARDARLDRDVAVKVLPEHVSLNPEVRTRFEREAKTISSLNHPHICVLHDVGREGQIDYIVMELVDGETLDARLALGPLPPGEVLKLGAQIADALDRAHRAGVVHRDLKPGNVMVTRSGAKLMDFGLARAIGPQSGVMNGSIAELTESPTEAQPLTAEGAIVGTFQYMSPEQLEGREVDERTDLWALGCVLYEMVTGKRAFEGKSQASLIGAIMHVQPVPVSQVVPVAPPQLDRLVTACLAKNPDDRVQSAHDMKLQLEWAADGTASTASPDTALKSRGRSRGTWARVAGAILACVMVTAAATTYVMRGSSAPATPPAPLRFVVGSADLHPASAPMLSPDGRYIVFSANEGASCRLYRRNLSSWEMTPIPGTEDGRAPFFSPDGAWIGFCTPDAIRKVPAGGGAAQVIASYPSPNAGDWYEDGMIYFTMSGGGDDGESALARVPATGGRVEKLGSLDRDTGDAEAWLPEVLPDGEAVLVSIIGGGSNTIVAFRPDGSRSTVVERGFLSRYAGGYLFYRDDESEAVLAAPFDPAALRVTGPAVPLTEAVHASFCYDVRADGRLVYVPLPGAGQTAHVVWVDGDGNVEPAADMQAPWAQPRVSPDGSRVVVRKVGTNCELWMLDVERRSLGRIVQGDDNHDPVWSPDGTRIAFARDQARELVAISVTGPRRTDVIAQKDHYGRPGSWAAGLLAYTREGRGTRRDIWIIDMDGAGEPRPLIASGFEERLPAIHPGGNWIAYTSNETGSREVYLRACPDGDTTWQVTTGGGDSPVWSPDGRRLFYLTGTTMMAVPVSTDPTLSLGTPVEILDGDISVDRSRNFDVAPDGRFVTTHRPGNEAGLQELRVLLNWPQEMERMTGRAP